MEIYSDYSGFRVGEIVDVNCHLPFKRAIVAAWTPDVWLRKVPMCLGSLEFRPGLVPLYSPKFPETMFWWAHPCQIRRTE